MFDSSKLMALVLHQPKFIFSSGFQSLCTDYEFSAINKSFNNYRPLQYSKTGKCTYLHRVKANIMTHISDKTYLLVFFVQTLTNVKALPAKMAVSVMTRLTGSHATVPPDGQEQYVTKVIQFTSSSFEIRILF